MAKHDLSSPSKIAQLLSEQEDKTIPESKILQLYLTRLIEYGHVQKEARGEYTIVDPILTQYLKRKLKWITTTGNSMCSPGFVFDLDAKPNVESADILISK